MLNENRQKVLSLPYSPDLLILVMTALSLASYSILDASVNETVILECCSASLATAVV